MSLQELSIFIKEVLLEVSPKDLVASTSQVVRDRAGSRPAKLSRVDRVNNVWAYSVPGNGNTWTVRIKVLNASGKTPINSDILVTCNCPFFRWQGPEHWAKVDKYLYQNPIGTASDPVQQDPQGVKKICKHAVSALELLKNVQL